MNREIPIVEYRVPTDQPFWCRWGIHDTHTYYVGLLGLHTGQAMLCRCYRCGKLWKGLEWGSYDGGGIDWKEITLDEWNEIARKTL